MKNIIDIFELGLCPTSTTLAEPNLGKRDLYSTISKKGMHDEKRKFRMNLIAYADGKNTFFDIAKILNRPLSDLINEYKILKSNQVLR